MRAISVHYDDQEELKSIDLNITVSEALALVNLLGKMNGHAHKKLKIDSDMYDCLSTIFNRHDDDGYKDLHFEFESLNSDIK